MKGRRGGTRAAYVCVRARAQPVWPLLSAERTRVAALCALAIRLTAVAAILIHVVATLQFPRLEFVLKRVYLRYFHQCIQARRNKTHCSDILRVEPVY